MIINMMIIGRLLDRIQAEHTHDPIGGTSYYSTSIDDDRLYFLCIYMIEATATTAAAAFSLYYRG